MPHITTLIARILYMPQERRHRITKRRTEGPKPKAQTRIRGKHSVKLWRELHFLRNLLPKSPDLGRDNKYVRTNTANKTQVNSNPATRNRIRDLLTAAKLYSQMLYQLSYSRPACTPTATLHEIFHALRPGLQ